MLTAIDPVEHSIGGLAGGIHNDYRSEVVRVENLGGGLRRIYCRLTDDMAKPEGARRRPTVICTVVAPYLDQYYVYRREMWKRIENGGSLNDITVPLTL
jgi:hypothetical protein